MERIVRVRDDRLVLLAPFEGREVQDHVVGQFRIVRPKRRRGAGFVTGDDVERRSGTGVRGERHRRVEEPGDLVVAHIPACRDELCRQMPNAAPRTSAPPAAAPRSGPPHRYRPPARRPGRSEFVWQWAGIAERSGLRPSRSVHVHRHLVIIDSDGGGCLLLDVDVHRARG